MPSVRLEPVRWYDDEFPGWIQVELHESDGAVARLVDKAPVFDATGTLAPGSALPAEIWVPCEIVSRDVDLAGKVVAVVRLHFGLADRGGRTMFRINADQIVETM